MQSSFLFPIGSNAKSDDTGRASTKRSAFQGFSNAAMRLFNKETSVQERLVQANSNASQQKRSAFQGFTNAAMRLFKKEASVQERLNQTKANCSLNQAFQTAVETTAEAETTAETSASLNAEFASVEFASAKFTPPPPHFQLVSKLTKFLTIAIASLFLIGCDVNGGGSSSSNGDIPNLSSAKDITSFSFSSGVIKEAVIDESKLEINVTIDYYSTKPFNSTNPTPIVTTSANADYSPTEAISTFGSAITYVVTAEDSSTKDYQALVKRAIVVSNEIDLLNAFDAIAADSSLTQIDLLIANDITLSSPFTIPSDWSSKGIVIENNSSAPNVTITGLIVDEGSATLKGGVTFVYRVSFYDANLDFNGSINVSSNAINLTQLKDDLDINASALFAASSDDDVLDETAYPVTSDIRLYAEANVTEINNVEGLGKVRDNLDGAYILLNDIALVDDDYANLNGLLGGWEPISGDATHFTGIFNGDNHKISGIFFRNAIRDYIGLFGYIENAQIRNLGVEIAEGKAIIGKNYVGAIAGYASNSNIVNSYAAGDISGTQYVGGIAGYVVYHSGIADSYSKANVVTDAGKKVGGIVGEITSESSLTNSYAEGNVSGADHIGGIAGSVTTNSKIAGSYSTGDVVSTAEGYTGGIAGDLVDSLITNSYATGNVSGTLGQIGVYARYIGGITGRVSGDNGLITNSYAEGNVSGKSQVGGIAGYVNRGTITNSYATGNVVATDAVAGGIAGYVYWGGSVTNSYAAGSVSGTNQVGGIAGYLYGSPGATTVTNNVAINPSVSADGNVSRVAGFISAHAHTIENNFARSDMTITEEGASRNDGTPKSFAELKTRSTYEDAINGDGLGGLGWLFGDDSDHPWKIDSSKNNGLPYLYWETR
ncbi:MAG: hypothetical protein LBO72_07870 [Helicobacteraceae bacterium]|jgi:hypothetical protein|nr:hypothetical protein [Helicobacteraceae bacterium]